MNFWKELLTRLLAVTGYVSQAGTNHQNQGITPPVEPKSLSDTKNTVLFEPISSRHLINDVEPHGFFPDSDKQAVSFQSHEQLTNIGASDSLSFTKDGPQMRPLEKPRKQKIKTKKKGRNLREEESGSNEEEQEYTTVAMRSDDGNAYAHCAVFPDGKAVACVQYIHNGVQNTTMIMIDPNDFGSHTLTTVTSDDQIKYFKDNNHMEAPAVPEHEPESRRRRLQQENYDKAKPETSNRVTTGIIEFTMAVAIDQESINALGGMDRSQAQIAIQISLLNQVLQRSGLNLRIRLTTVIENPAIASGDTQRELRYATDNIDRGNADFLMSIIGSRGSSSAWLYNERPPNAAILKKQLVSVVRYNMLPGKTFQHEFGHNIAGQHQRQYSYTSGRRFPNAYAFSDYYEEVGTVLAYLRNPADRFPLYSSATGIYENVRVGDASTDNASAMQMVINEIDELLERGRSTATAFPTPRPTIAVYTAPPTRRVTPAPTISSKAPSTRRVTARPTVTTTKAPSSRKTTGAPVAHRTKVPTKNPTAAPTLDQTPLLPVNKLVDFSFDVDPLTPNVPLTIQIGSARKVTITNSGVTIVNAANTAVSPDNYVLNSAILSKINFGSGINNNFRLINTGTEINLYHIPLVQRKIKRRVQFVPGAPQLLLSLNKISATGNNMLGNDLPISFSRATTRFVNVGAVKNVATRPPVRGRLLEDNEAVPGAVINFIDFTNDPKGETKKLLSAEYEPGLRIIASSSDNILKFIDDATFSLGEKEAFKLMNSGVMSKIFDLTDKKTLVKLFKQLHSYHKIELIQHVNYRMLDTNPVFKQAAAMRAAALKFGEDDTSDESSKKSVLRKI